MSNSESGNGSRLDLSEAERGAVRRDWEIWRAGHQVPPQGGWRIWLILGGRGAGKTRAGAEWVRAAVEAERAGRIALIAPTFELAREVMIDGPSGFRAIAPAKARPRYVASRHALEWPNGAVASVFSAEDPDSIRGPQHDLAWGDEFCAWPRAQAVLDMVRMGLRVGEDPRCLLTTTPRPIPALKALLASGETVVTRGRTDEANFLPEAFRAAMREAYGGTALGAQELDGEVVEDRAGALWTHAMLEGARGEAPARLDRIVVAVDPPVTAGPRADGCGIVVAGAAGEGLARRAFVLADASVQGRSPDGWAQAVAAAFEAWEADRVVAEVNQGGDLVTKVLRSAAPNLPVTTVRASRGKAARAEPVAALYEQGRVTHCGVFEALETELRALGTEAACADDRADALVWALSELMLNAPPEPRARWL